jgi:hypothetical protein
MVCTQPPLTGSVVFLLQRKNPTNKSGFFLEQVGGIEPPHRPWQGRVLPLNHTCSSRLALSSHPIDIGVLRYAVAPLKIKVDSGSFVSL